MKTKLFLILLLSHLSLFAQSIEQLKVATKKIYDANYTMDFDAISELTYPEIITPIGKSKFMEALDSDYQNDEYRMRLELVSPQFQYGAIQKIEGKSYCVVTYKNPIRYFFETKLNTTTAAEKVTQLRQINQTNDVTFEPKRNSFNVRRTSKMIAIADETTGKEWRFFNLDNVRQRQLFETSINSVVKKQLGL